MDFQRNIVRGLRFPEISRKDLEGTRISKKKPGGTRISKKKLFFFAKMGPQKWLQKWFDLAADIPQKVQKWSNFCKNGHAVFFLDFFLCFFCRPVFFFRFFMFFYVFCVFFLFFCVFLCFVCRPCIFLRFLCHLNYFSM